LICTLALFVETLLILNGVDVKKLNSLSVGVVLVAGGAVKPVTSQDAATYNYDEQDRLIRISYANGKTINYFYDQQGRRFEERRKCER
jgi:YD repeat-containing protein